MKVIGSDLDGVIAIGTIDRQACVPFKLHKYYRSCEYSGFLKDVEDLIIISGRKEHFRKVTEEWLKKNSVSFMSLHMLPNGQFKTREYITQFKAKVINENNLMLYYEDDKLMAEELTRLCPICTVIFISDIQHISNS